MSTAKKTTEKVDPACKTERGYDTDVTIHPNYKDPEQYRTVKVKCTRHNTKAQCRFKTHGLSGGDVAKAQKKAFTACFDAVEKECHLIEYATAVYDPAQCV